MSKLETAVKNLDGAVNYIQFLAQGNSPLFDDEPLQSFFLLIQALEALSDSSINTLPVFFDLECEPSVIQTYDLLNDSSFLFDFYFVHLGSCTLWNDYFEKTNTFLLSENVSSALKRCFILSEFKSNLLFNSYFDYNHLALNAVQVRFQFCQKYIQEEKNTPFLDLIKKVYFWLLRRGISLFSYKGHFLQASNWLDVLLKDSKTGYEKETVLEELIYHNTTYNLVSTQELLEILAAHKYLYEPRNSEWYDTLVSEVCYVPNIVKILPPLIRIQGVLSYSRIKNKKVSTVISFSVPYACKNSTKVESALNSTTKLIISPVSAFWEDPMFKEARGEKLANMELIHYCDVGFDHTGPYTHISILVSDLIALDVNLTQDTSVDIDFSEEDAQLGRKYYPHKEYAIKILRENYNMYSHIIDMPKSNININLFSAFLVEYYDFEAREGIQKKFFLLTNPDSFSTVSTRFLERYNSINLSYPLADLRKMLTETVIESERNFAEFIYRCFDILLKHTVEKDSGYKYLWKDGEPLSEVNIQPYVFSHLRWVFDFMGIQISREVKASNGSIDFLVTYTNNHNKLMKVCVELKLAHSSKVHEGLTVQLPEYMSGERTKYGIFLLFWFKGGNFNKPKSHQSIQGLSYTLQRLNKNPNILSMIVDSSLPIPPSKKKKIK